MIRSEVDKASEYSPTPNARKQDSPRWQRGYSFGIDVRMLKLPYSVLVWWVTLHRGLTEVSPPHTPTISTAHEYASLTGT
jgi:hypothetical protein